MKQVKRYVLGILVSIETRKINETDCFLEDILTLIEKYNDNKANPYYLGDIKIDRKKGIITFKKYKKLTDMRTLKDLDKLTLNYNNEAELLRDLNISIDSNNPVLIMYRGQKTIKYLHVLYNKDRKYLDQGFVSSHFIENGRSFDFLTFLFSKNHFFKTAKNYDELEGLYNLRRDIMNNIPALISLTPMINFYNAFIAKNNKYNYFNFRMLGTLLKEYDSNNCDSKDLEEDTKEDVAPSIDTPTEDVFFAELKRLSEEMLELQEKIKNSCYTYKDGLQTILYEFKYQILIGIYLDVKDGALEPNINLEEEFQKRLKLAHETTK